MKHSWTARRGGRLHLMFMDDPQSSRLVYKPLLASSQPKKLQVQAPSNFSWQLGKNEFAGQKPIRFYYKSNTGIGVNILKLIANRSKYNCDQFRAVQWLFVTHIQQIGISNATQCVWDNNLISPWLATSGIHIVYRMAFSITKCKSVARLAIYWR